MLRIATVAVIACALLLSAGCRKGRKPAEKKQVAPEAEPAQETPAPGPALSAEPAPAPADVRPAPPAAPADVSVAPPPAPEVTQPPAPTTGPELWTAACKHAVFIAHNETDTMLHLAPVSEMNADCIAEFERISGDLADKAAGCMLAAKAFDDLSPCYDTTRWKKDAEPVQGNGPELWNRACDHIVTLVTSSPEFAGAAAEAGAELKRSCVQEFTTAEHEAADQAAACMLSQTRLDGMDGCVLKLRAAKDKETKERPPLVEDPWLEAMTLGDQVHTIVEQGLDEPDKLIQSLTEWYATNEKNIFNACARMVRLPLEDTATDFTDRIAAFSQHQAPASIEAVADKIRTGVEDPAHRKELLSLLFRFREVCSKAIATASQ